VSAVFNVTYAIIFNFKVSGKGFPQSKSAFRENMSGSAFYWIVITESPMRTSVVTTEKSQCTHVIQFLLLAHCKLLSFVIHSVSNYISIFLFAVSRVKALLFF
jgi:hypothetical protein